MKKYIAVFALLAVMSSCSAIRTQPQSAKNVPAASEPSVSTPAPTLSPTIAPTSQPTASPTASPTAAPTAKPTEKPTASPEKEKTSETASNTASDTASIDSIDNKGSGWGFKKNKGEEPSIYDSTKKLFAKYDTYYMDSSKPKALYLTFDEGYENGYTAPILDVLKEHNVPAAFFITGPYAKEQETLVRRMIDEGHIIGNHTVHHPNLPKLGSSSKMLDELDSLNKTVEEKYGVRMKYMRPPEGEWSERLLAAAQKGGYKTILWSFAYRDWDTKSQKGADYAFEQVTPYLHDGAILLLHAVSSDNAQALGRIIEYAKEQGYEFRSLDELS